MDREQTADTATADTLNGAIEKLMANPELITMVASALGKNKVPAAERTEPREDPPPPEGNPLPPVAPVASEAPAASNTPELGKLIATISPILSGAGGKQDDPRSCLLRALKPYVKPARRDAIDTMIRLSQISDVLRHMNS